ncbi:MAG: diguanylate cyclase domain protein [Sporomusa sp.]|nr:diguanylate cyclase domain protein [Sporomusa sp.]
MRFLHKFTLLLGILIIISGFIQFTIFERSFIATTNSLFLATNEKAAHNVGEQLVAYFSKIETSLKAIAASERIRSDPKLLDDVNSFIPELDLIFIIDKQGHVLLASGITGVSPDLDLSQRDYFQQAIRGETYISGVFTSQGGRKVISIATPIVENGTIAGVVFGVIRLHGDTLASMFGDKSFGRGGFIAILDRQGTIVYHNDRERIGQMGRAFNQLQGISGSTVMQYDSDANYYLGYSKVPGLNWTVIVNTPAAEITQLRNRMIYEILAVSLLVILVIIAIGTYTVRRYTKPLDKLVEAFSAVKRGKYKKIAPYGYAAEFDEMIQVYNDTIEKLEEVHTTLEGAADMDDLTNVYNRRSFDKILGILDSEIQDNSLETIGIMILDIDNFKQTNDTQGHLSGDEVLKEFAAIIVSVVGVRAVFRFGGDEFAVILRNSSYDGIAFMAEEIRLRCEQSFRGYTVSIGTATYPRNADSIGELLKLADKALYISKEIRNKVTAYETSN